jgi:predicted secreted protein
MVARVLVLWGLAAAAALGCRQSPPDARRASGDTRRDTARTAALRSYQLAVGETLTVRLPANATTGFEWRLVDSTGGVVTLSSEQYVMSPAPEGMVGTGGSMLWRLVAARPGRDTLRFVNYSPGGTAAQQEVYEVVVR